MKIAINTLPLRSAHKFRGIGSYTKNLIEALEKAKDIELTQFSKISEVNNCSAVHYPWFDLFFHTLPLQRKFPTVVTIHDLIPLVFGDFYPTGLKAKFNLFLQKIALRTCQFIITDSNASKKDIIKHLKIQDEKIEVIPLAASGVFQTIKNDTKLLQIKKKYSLPDRFLLYVGDANRVKNIPFLIEAFHALVGEKGLEDIKLVLAGGVFLKNVENIDHPELRGIKDVNRMIKEYHLEEKIIKPGFLEEGELAAFYNLATVYVQPSLYEGFGIPLLEAFACGTPVVSSNRGSLPEVGGEAAIYFDPLNIKQFIFIIKDLLEDTSLRWKLVKLGFEQGKKFSWEKCAENTKLVYVKAAKNGKEA